jgi:hypothetical protein
MTERVWILGAPDLEMDAIEQLLDSAGEVIAYAQTLDSDHRWRRVHDGNAYAKPDVYARLPVCPEKTFYFIECHAIMVDFMGKALRAPPAWIECNSKIIEHHRPGDLYPGSFECGQPPTKFLPASSIGQVIRELASLGRLGLTDLERLANLGQLPSGRLASIVPVESLAELAPSTSSPHLWPREHHCLGNPGEWVLGGFRGMWKVGEKMSDPNLVRPVGIPQDILLIAACDHCLGAAYAGECSGVYPLDVLGYRTKVRAAVRKCTEKEVSQDIEKAFKCLDKAQRIVLGNSTFSDVRGMELPELTDAGAYLNISYLAGPVEDASGRKKITCRGRSDDIEGFFTWAKEEGMTDVHGDLASGFGEAYLL